jgi:hypothetical protein
VSRQGERVSARNRADVVLLTQIEQHAALGQFDSTSIHPNIQGRSLPGRDFDSGDDR